MGQVVKDGKLVDTITGEVIGESPTFGGKSLSFGGDRSLVFGGTKAIGGSTDNVFSRANTDSIVSDTNSWLDNNRIGNISMGANGEYKFGSGPDAYNLKTESSGFGDIVSKYGGGALDALGLGAQVYFANKNYKLQEEQNKWNRDRVAKNDQNTELFANRVGGSYK